MLIRVEPKSNASAIAVKLYGELLDEIKGESLVPAWIENGELNLDDLAWPLDSPGRIFVCGCGKASASMALGIEKVLGDRIDRGFIVTKTGHGLPLKRCDVLEAGHPVPDQNSITAGERMLEFAATCHEDDLVIFLLSGGASSLMEVPADGLQLEDLVQTNRALLNSGLDIRTINRIRARLSKIKGGKLGAAFGRATVFGLVMNDIPDGNVEEVGSGPLKSSISGLPRLGAELINQLPEKAVALLSQPSSTISNENVILRSIASNWIIRQAFETIAAKHHLQVTKNIKIKGDGRKQIEAIARRAKTLKKNQCLLAFGESTLEIKGPGKGGRCQEMALLAAQSIRGQAELAILVGGTDGTDGPTDAAGAVVDGQTLIDDAVAEEAKRALECSDSYTFHDRHGSLLKTGPTGSNLNDILIAVRA